MRCRMDTGGYSRQSRLEPRMIFAGRNVSRRETTCVGEYPVVINPIWPCPYIRVAHAQCEGFYARLAYRIPMSRYAGTLLDLEYQHTIGIGLLDIVVTVRVGIPLTLSLDKLDLLERAG